MQNAQKHCALELRHSTRLSVLVLAANAFFLLYITIHGTLLQQSPFPWLGISSISMTLAQISFSLAHRNVERERLVALTPIFVLLLLPFAIAFGTANDLAEQTSFSIFPVLVASALAGSLLLAPASARALVGGLAIGAFCLVLHGTMVPYGLTAPVWNLREPIKIPLASDRLDVDAMTRTYVKTLGLIGASGGIRAGTPIIDLSGGGPGTAIFLGGTSPATPWFIPQAPKIVDAVWATLDREERSRAWFVGPIAPGFGGTQLVSYLAQRRKDYQCVGKLQMTFWGQLRVITIWKPLEDGSTLAIPASAACADAQLALSTTPDQPRSANSNDER